MNDITCCTYNEQYPSIRYKVCYPKCNVLPVNKKEMKLFLN